jgi:hypothetical protein
MAACLLSCLEGQPMWSATNPAFSQSAAVSARTRELGSFSFQIDDIFEPTRRTWEDSHRTTTPEQNGLARHSHGGSWTGNGWSMMGLGTFFFFSALSRATDITTLLISTNPKKIRKIYSGYGWLCECIFLVESYSLGT